jgi:putative tricarboxylic transport membrane protein
MRRMDFITGLVTAAVGAAALWDARDLHMFGQNNVPGPGFFPNILAGLLVALGLILAGLALRPVEPAVGNGQDDETAVEGPTRNGRLRAAAVLVAFGIIAPLVAVIGYVPAMMLLVLVVLYGIERRRDFRSLVAALLIPTATYLLFAHAFSIPLPPGPLLPA